MSVINDAMKTAQREQIGQPDIQADQHLLEELFFRPSARLRFGIRDVAVFLAASATVVVVTAVVYVKFNRVPPEPARPVVQSGHPAIVSADPVTSTTFAKPLATDSAIRPSQVRENDGGSSRQGRLESPAGIRGMDSPTPPRLTRTLRPALVAAGSSIRIQLSSESAGGSDSLFLAARIAHRQRDLPRAQALYARALASGEGSADAYNDYGALLFSVGDVATAVRMYRNAIDKDRSHVAALMNLALALDSLGERSEATGALERVLSLEPSNVQARLQLSEQYEAANVPDAARRVVEDAVTLDPNDAAARYQLARLLERERDFAGAIRELTAFLRLGAGKYPASLLRDARVHIDVLSSRPR